MASEGPNVTGTATSDATVGDDDWSSVTNVEADDANYAYCPLGTGTYLDYVVSLVKGGTITGDNNASGTAWTNTADTFDYGGATDMWGVTLTATDVNASTFGCVLEVEEGGDNYSEYLKCVNFGFSIPAGATIDGVEVHIKRRWNYFVRSRAAEVYFVKMTVYYTEASGGTGMQVNIGDAWKSISAAKINIGDTWKDVEGMQINIGDTWKTIF